MNFKIIKNCYECPEGFAVFSIDGKFDSCHFTKDKAVRRIEMLYKMKEIDVSN